MRLLDDTAIFAAVVKQGGFSHAAKHLGLSNGLVSRRIAQLEAQLGVALIKRTTRQLHLTPEGELFWQHAKRIQQELDSALSLIQSLAEKPKGLIRVSAPIYFGRRYLMPIINKFLENFCDIKIDLILANERLDPLKEDLDLIIRGIGYLDPGLLVDSTLKSKLLLQQKIGLYASPEYLAKYGEPQTLEALTSHRIISHLEKRQAQEITWTCHQKNKPLSINVKPQLNCNDMEVGVESCLAGRGIGRFPEMVLGQASDARPLRQILTQYDWGEFHLYAIYPDQQSLPKRTRLFLDCISACTKHLTDNICQKKENG